MNKFTLFMCGVLIFSSCVSYKPDPIDRQEINKKILKELKPPEIKDSAFQFKDAVNLMSRYNKQLSLLKLAYRNSVKAAKIKTPIPNPEVSLGLARAFRLEEKTAASTQPFLSAVFTIPLSGKLSLRDDLSQLEAEQHLQRLIAEHRSLFLKLRRAFINYSINRNNIVQQKKVISFMGKVIERKKKLVESGFYTALDIKGIELDTLSQKSELMKIEALGISKKGKLEELLSKAVRADVFEEPLNIDFSVPEIEDIWKLALKNNSGLNEIFMEHTIAEKKLELEIRKQYPDLKIGTGLAQEPGERKRLLSLEIGFDLPVFDRNQVEIKKALSVREELKIKFEKEATEIRLKLKNGLHLLKKELTNYRHFKENVLPKMGELLKAAEKAVEVGELKISRYWDLKARSLQIERELSQKRTHIYTVVSNLEQIVGRPLIKIFKFDRQLFAELEVEK